MANITHTVTPTEVDILSYENYSEQDFKVLESYKINKLFSPSTDEVQLHIYSMGQELLLSDYKYTGHKQLLNSASAGKDGASSLFVDPVHDAVTRGYEKGDVQLLYIFGRNLLQIGDRTGLYIEDISPDRTELKLNSIKFASKLQGIVDVFKADFETTDDTLEFRLDFGNNDLFIATNLDILDGSLVVKLYEPLPSGYGIKAQCTLLELVADSVQYILDSEVEYQAPTTKKLREANFNLDILDETLQPSQYFTFDELFSLPTNSTNYQAIALANKENVELAVDYTSFGEFVHFSSAVERLQNFKYKLDLIHQYEDYITVIDASTTTSTVAGKNKEHYENLIKGIIKNFDGYERYLFFENTSNAWPKANTTKPYENLESTDPVASAFYTAQLEEAIIFDTNNYNSLRNTVPAFIKEDASNEAYVLFIDMIAQHFDNLWLYAKEVTKKYDGDNRLDFGISKELVEVALKNFGMKLYTSNLSLENLLGYFSGEEYDAGDEVINNYEVATTGITGNFQPMPYRNYQQEVYKRLYHNLPHLIKTKGTRRGLTALMNCFGLPPEILKIKEYGGTERNLDYYVGYDKPLTDARDKIRVRELNKEGTTLSSFTSIQNSEKEFTQDLHIVEIGFSPAESINAHIESTITGNYVASNYVLADYVANGDFDIDSFIGDPTLANQAQYKLLSDISRNVTENLDSYDLFDFVRIIKFLDNTIFKMVKDFIPARDTVSTGIIIKPHHLNRSKIAIPTAEWERLEYEGLIEIGDTSGSDGGMLTDENVDHSLTYSYKSGFANKAIDRDTPKYDGELKGTSVDVLSGDLNGTNPFLDKYHPVTTYNTTVTTNASNFNSTTPSAGQVVIFYEELTVAETPIDTGGLDGGSGGPVDGGGSVGGGGSTPTTYSLSVNIENLTGETLQDLSALINVSINGTGVFSGNTTYTATVNSGDTVQVSGSWAVNDFTLEDYKAELYGDIVVSATHASPKIGSTTVSGNTSVTFRLKP